MAATGIRVGGGRTNCAGPLGETISARVSPPLRWTRPRVSRSAPFCVCRVRKRKAPPPRASSPSSLDATLIFHEAVIAISVVMSRLRCQPAQSSVRSCTAVPMRGALTAAPSRSAYSARCGCICAPAACGRSRAAAKAKRTTARMPAPCAGAPGRSIVRAMILRRLIAATWRRTRRRRRWPEGASRHRRGVQGRARLELKRDGAVRKTTAWRSGLRRKGARSGRRRSHARGQLHDRRAQSRSAFHLSLRVSYPDEHDQARARHSACRRAVTLIHGQPNSLRKLFVGHPARDWTTGCVAVTDREIREIWSLVPTGARVVIHP